MDLKWNNTKRIKIRGYNQSVELAREFCKLAQLPYVDYATRETNNPSQTELSLKERKENVKDIFKLTNQAIKDKNILIIDDIYTTGATVNELAKLLKRANAKSVYVLTVGHSLMTDYV